jgi:hypothetical protein
MDTLDRLNSEKWRPTSNCHLPQDAGSVSGDSSNDGVEFNNKLNGGIDISMNHGHGTAPTPGRESHTADLDEFDRYIAIMEKADRLDEDLLPGDIIVDEESNDGNEEEHATTTRTMYPFNGKIWTFIRSLLSNAIPVGFTELQDPNATIHKGPEDANNFLSKVIAIDPLNPIHPAVIAKMGEFDEYEVLAELFYGVVVGLVAMSGAVQSAAKGSECFITETTLKCCGAEGMQAYDEITRGGSTFKATPLVELSLKGVDEKVYARGFRWSMCSQRQSELRKSIRSYYGDRRANSRIFISFISIGDAETNTTEGDDETVP